MTINTGKNSSACNPQSPRDSDVVPPTDDPTCQTDANHRVMRSREGLRKGGRSYSTLQRNVPNCLETTSLRKRSRDGGDSGAGPSVPPQQRPVPAVAVGMFECAMCGLRFDAEKSLAGHMRMHPNRQWRGMFPPPVFTRDDFADVIELLNKPEEEEENGEADGGNTSGRMTFNLPDLNKSP